MEPCTISKNPLSQAGLPGCAVPAGCAGSNSCRLVQPVRRRGISGEPGAVQPLQPGNGNSRKERETMEQTNYSRSPCFGCTRVKEPEKCENKKCVPWREWFLASWEKCRTYPWGEMVQRQAAQLTEDPCLTCRKLDRSCQQPCGKPGIWRRMKQEV